jgi:hypothetical protein
MTARIAALAVMLTLGAAATASAAPLITPSVYGTLGNNDWYTSAVTVNWNVRDSDGAPITSQTPSCLATTFSADTASVTQTCTATSATGTTSATTPRIRIDRTPPVAITAATSRPADHGRWFIGPVGITFSGTDSLSGIAQCTTASYAGPDSPGAGVTGTCRDAAGNTSAPFTLPLAYDATPPSLSDVTATPGDTTAALAWKPSPDTLSVSVVASAAGLPSRTVYQGPGTSVRDSGLANGVAYNYTVTAFDAAGNSASQTASATPASKLVAPLPNAQINGAKARSKPPKLSWEPRAGATYYNVQIFRRIDGRWRKVLSRWPRTNHLQLPSRWSYRGKRWKLTEAHYRWYVWPGYGEMRRHHYGKLLGRRDFFVTGA